MKKLNYKTLMLLCFTMFAVSTASASWAENKNTVSSNGISKQSHNYTLEQGNWIQYKNGSRGISSEKLARHSNKFNLESNHKGQEVRLGKEDDSFQPRLFKLVTW